MLIKIILRPYFRAVFDNFTKRDTKTKSLQKPTKRNNTATPHSFAATANHISHPPKNTPLAAQSEACRQAFLQHPMAEMSAKSCIFARSQGAKGGKRHPRQRAKATENETQSNTENA